MKRYGLYILDLDGTVYRGKEAVPGAPEAIRALLARGAHVRYVTNNSAARPEAVAAKLTALGATCEPEWVFSSGVAAAALCLERGLKRVYVLGEPDLEQTCRERGLIVTAEADAVIVGVCRTLTYQMILKAMRLIRGGAEFVATNRDATYPLENGEVEPGAGTMVAAVEVCSGRSPIVAGKPESGLILAAMESAGVGPESTLVVGDRLDTDIQAGLNAGCDTWLVLSGVTDSAPAGQASGRSLLDLLA